MPDQMCYNISAEIRIAQGCFVFSQRYKSQINNLALVGKQPCIISCGRKSCNLVSAADGSMYSAGLFAYKGEWIMLHSMGKLDGITILFDADSKQVVVTIEDAMSANIDTLLTIQEICERQPEEVNLIGQYVAAGRKWLSSFASDNDLWMLRCSETVPDHIKETIKAELNKRFKERLGYVYFLQADNGLVKIGQSKVLNKRIGQLAVSLPYKLQLILTIKSEDYVRLESHLHEMYAEQRMNGEWFALTEDDLAYIEDRYGTPSYVEHEDLFFEGE